MDWTGGYVADIGYTAGFYPETTPNHLAFAALSASRSPGRALRAERMLELGFGQGFGLALIAAANPQLECEGYDFNPEHVAHAQGLIKGAGLNNLKVAEASFEEAALRGGENDVDTIAAHGIFSWVSRQAQDAILAVIRQRLQPNGLAYISYNSMPGWAPIVPLKQFMREVKRRHPGRSSDRQLALALDMLTKLKDANAGYFAGNPAAAAHLNSLLQQDRIYLIHEYLDEHWELYQFSDMVARVGEAKLAFVCSATLSENLDAYAVPQPLAQLVATTEDPVLREIVRDYATNKRFRRDIYARGSAAMTPTEHRRALSELRFTATVPRKAMSFTFLVPIGQVTGIGDIYEPVADLLAEKVASFDELLALPPFAGGKLGNLLDCLTLLVGSSQVLPIVAKGEVDAKPGQRFNRLVMERVRAGRAYHYLAAPFAGTGITVAPLPMLVYGAMIDGQGDDAASAAKHGFAVLKNSGKLPMKEGRLLDDEAEALAFLEESFAPIIADTVPIWRRLGVL